MENYWEIVLTDRVQPLRLKADVVPHIFSLQSEESEDSQLPAKRSQLEFTRQTKTEEMLSSVIEAVPNIEEEQKVCRTCLTNISIQSPSSTFIPLADGATTQKGTVVREMLEQCVPSMALDISLDPVICETCTIQLEASHEFVAKCLATEEKILSYISRSRNVDRVDLTRVIDDTCSVKKEVFDEEVYEIHNETSCDSVVINGENDIKVEIEDVIKIEPIVCESDNLDKSLNNWESENVIETEPVDCKNDNPSNSASNSELESEIQDSTNKRSTFSVADSEFKVVTTANVLKIQHSDHKNQRAQVKSPNMSSLDLICSINKKDTKKRRRKKVVCKFCRIGVLNFHRHLTRHHMKEKEVQDYLNFPKYTKKGKLMRRKILALLRNEANFEKFLQNRGSEPNKLPCAHCKQIVVAKYLARHYKTCIMKPINETGRSVRHQAASQTLVACASDNSNAAATLRVTKEVFTRMAADKIGFLARTDPLIRYYGEYYLKKYRQAHITTTCSNKMRECARLLIEMRQQIGKPKLSFFQLLDSALFDDIVLCTKVISGYDGSKTNYEAPGFALKMGATLQHMCEITTHLLLKESPEFKCDNFEQTLKAVKRFKLLVQSQWNRKFCNIMENATITNLLHSSDQQEEMEHINEELQNVDNDPSNKVVEFGDDFKILSSKLCDEECEKQAELSVKMENKSGGRIRWTAEQKELVMSHFKNHIKMKKAPRKGECEDLITKHKEVLSNMDWVRVKTFVYNVYIRL